MFNEITQRDIRTAVNAHFPGLNGWLEDAHEALYRALWVGTLTANAAPYIEGKAPAVAVLLHQGKETPPDVVTLAGFYGLVAAAYYDAWLECHASGAQQETAELPPPPGWVAAPAELPAGWTEAN